MTLTEYIRTNAASLVREWVHGSSPSSVAAGHYSAAELGDRLQELLLHVAANIDDAACESDASGKNQRDFAAWGQSHAKERLRQGFSLNDVVAEFCGLRVLVLQNWNRFPLADSAPARRDLLRFNRALDLGLAESIQHYSRAQTHTRDLFTGMLVHDLRNPLASIINLAAVLTRTPDGAGSTVQIARKLQRASTRMQAIIEEMLDVLRTRLGQLLPITPAPASLRDINQRVIEELAELHPDCKIEFTAEGNVDGVWDAERLWRVLSNLISNAVKYRAAGTSVRIAVADRGDAVETRISNQGSAIAAEDLVSMFDPMVRLRQHASYDSEASPGLGLGLYVARQLVLAHGGSIEARSSDGWNIFTVRLPRASKVAESKCQGSPVVEG